MGSAIALREDFDGSALRALARFSKDNRQTRRLLALAAIYDGLDRAQAAHIGGMDRQTLRDWVIRFNEHGPDGLFDANRSGRPRLLSDDQLAELGRIVESGPDKMVDGLVRWRRVDLIGVIEERFGVCCSKTAVSDYLSTLGFSHISGRPQHPKQDPKVIEAFKKTSPIR